MMSAFNLLLLVASGLVGLIGGVSALRALPGHRFARPELAAGRVAASALVLTATVWVVFLLVLNVAFPRLAPELTWSAILRSWIIIAAGCCGALGTAAFGARNVRNAALAGSLLCAAVSCMVFASMSALASPSVLAYDLKRVLGAMAAGSALCGGGLWLRGRGTSATWPFLPAALIATALVLLAVVSLSSILPFVDWDAAAATPGAMAFRPVTVVFLSELAVTCVLGLAGAGVDREAAARIWRENERLRQLTESTFEALLVHRDGKVLDANSAFCDLIGQPREVILGQQVATFVPAWDRAAPVSPATGRPQALETEIGGAGGASVPVEILSRDIPYGGGAARVTALRDIRERRAAETKIRFLAQHDLLTGLANRARFLDIMGRQLALVQRDGMPVAVFAIDLDRFKSVNDTLGHQAGDLLLKQVAQRILTAIRETDTLARIGGDEFILLQTAAAQPAAAAQLARRLIAKLAEPFDLDGHQACIGASIGVALSPQDGRNANDLLRNADIALYRAKTSGRGQFCFFKVGMDTLLRQRREMEQDLARTLAAGGFELAFQPLFSGPASDELTGFEALLRWPSPERGPTMPEEFIPLAEETGLIIPLGAWVLETACREAASWPVCYRIAVNVSPRQLASSNFAALVADVLERTRLAADRLEIEITETALITDAAAAMQVLRGLKRLGVRIALDDFGTGYSSLAYLQRFPFDRVKIDKSFIQSLADNEDTRAIVGAILAMCRQLRLEVTAEGVENADQLMQLRAQHCDQIQGFLLARPIPHTDVGSYISRQREHRNAMMPLAAG
jgi:diguanylate cyclase (GGDEF)-like protein/PAS domain S-box-containing protein